MIGERSGRERKDGGGDRRGEGVGGMREQGEGQEEWHAERVVWEGGREGGEGGRRGRRRRARWSGRCRPNTMETGRGHTTERLSSILA